ncbi:chemotaxis protein CheW [Clostridium polynesiense]|uniref:chemotaxis protein CheW n=1 Tax=Clostridium polynesiense TaxID=1325933 RepID=UPI00058E3257|nr:chemotaxis protein CheW [Clostridium polynesiense]
MNSSEIKVLIFTLNDEFYATDIMDIERILGYEEPTTLPEAPEFIEGVINYEGMILPVVSLAKKFNMKNTKKEDSKVIVVKQKNDRIGIVVDQVTEVGDIKLDEIENPPHISTDISRRYIKGLIKVKEKIVIFLNLAEILSHDEKQLLK